MALPVIPLLVVGLVVVAAAGGKRKRSKPMTITADTARGSGGEEEPGPPGSLCGVEETAEGYIHYAFTHEGECVPFWSPETEDVMIPLLWEAYDEVRPRPEDACALDVISEDPFEEYASAQLVELNPTRVEIVRRAIRKAYPQISPDALPPIDEGRDYSTYEQVVWDRASYLYMREICGYEAVT